MQCDNGHTKQVKKLTGPQHATVTEIYEKRIKN